MEKVRKYLCFSIILALFLSVISFTPTFATGATISGKVRNAKWGPGHEQYLSGVKVYLDSKTGTYVTTDASGNYSMTDIGTGNHKLIYVLTGYADDYKEVTIAGTDTITIDMAMVQTGLTTLTDEVFFGSKIDLDYPGLSAVKTAYSAGDYMTAKGEIIKYYKDRTSPKWYVNPTNPQSSDIDPYYSTAVADDEASHYFTVTNIRANPDNPEGSGNINWLYIPSGATNEWKWQFNRLVQFDHYAEAWNKTLKSKYAYEFMSEMVDWIYDNPKPSALDTTNAWRTIEAGIRMQGIFPTSWNNILYSNEVTNEAKIDMLKSIWEHGDYLNNFPSSGNWILMESYGLYCIGTLHPYFNSAATWKNTAVSRMQTEMSTQLMGDGVQYELAANYHAVAVDNFAGIEKLANLNGETTALKTGLKISYDADMYLAKPNGLLPMINDTNYYDNRKQLMDGNLLYMDTSPDYGEDYLYAASGYKAGKAPSQKSAFLDYSGLITMRDYWGSNAVWALFDVGRKGIGNHNNHRDKLQFLLSAYGNDLLIDPGRGSYPSTMESALKLSQSHNVIMVDGRSQRIPAVPTLPITQITDAVFQTNAQYDYSEGTMNDKFEDWASGIDVTHNRKVFYAKSKYFIVSDLLTGSGTHTLDQFWNLAPGPYTYNSTKKSINTNFDNQGNVLILPADSSSLTADIQAGLTGASDADYRGWTANSTGHEEASPNIKYTKANVAVPNSFDTVIIPYKGSAAPDTNVDRIAIAQGGVNKPANQASALKIYGSTFTDYYIVNHSLTGDMTFDNFTFNGKACYVSKNASGTIIDVKAYAGSGTGVLKYNGSELKLPTGDLTSPESGSVINTNTVELTATAAPYPGQTIQSVTFYAGYWDGTQYQYPILGTDTTAPYSYTWDISGIPDQTGVKIFARVRDTQGNQAHEVGGVHTDITFDRSSKAPCTVEAEALNVTRTGSIRSYGEDSASNKAAVKMTATSDSISRNVNFTQAGSYSFKIRAKGVQSSGAPHMKVYLDSTVIGEFDVSNSADYQDYFITDYNISAEGTKALRIEYTNGNGGEWQLVIDAAFVEYKKQAEAFATRSSTHAVQVSDANAEGGYAMAIYSGGGYFENSFYFPEAKNYRFSIRARESHAGTWEVPNFARMIVKIDGNKIIDRYVVGNSFETYDIAVPVTISAGNHTVTFTMDNDATGRDLFIDSVEIVDDPNDYVWKQPVSVAKGGVSYGDAAWSNYTVQSQVKVSRVITSQSGEKGVALRARNKDGKGYSLYYNFADNKLYIKKYDNSEAWTTIGTAVSVAMSKQKWYNFKFDVNGSTLRGKIWEDGTAEPANWQITATDGSYTQGNIGLTSDRVDASWDDTLVIINGTTATTNMTVMLTYESGFAPGYFYKGWLIENGGCWRVDIEK